MDCSLLLSTSIVFNDSNIIDRVHQSFIDIQNEDYSDEIEQLVIEALTYLEKDVSYELASELFSLIIYCFSNYTIQIAKIFNLILGKAKFNSNYIIITTSIIPCLIRFESTLKLPNYHFFVDNSLKEILPQIQNSNQKIKIFNHQIPDQFKLNLILNLVLLSDLGEEIVSICCSYLFSQQNQNFCKANKEKIIKLIQNIIKKGLINKIIAPLVTNSYLQSILSVDDFVIILKSMTNDEFRQFFPKIENFYIKSSILNREFVLIFIQKCREMNLNINSIEKVFNYLSADDMTSDIIEYLNGYDFTLPKEIALKFVDHPDPHFVIKLFGQNFEFLPQKLKDVALLEINDVDSINSIFQYGPISSPVLTTSDFYLRVYSLLSENINEKTIKTIVSSLQRSNDDSKTIKIIDDMIFSLYPPNKQQIEFILLFVNSLDSNVYKLFSNESHMLYLIDEITKRKILPNYKFIELIRFQAISKIVERQFLLNEKKNQFYFYIYIFAKKDYKNESSRLLNLSLFASKNVLNSEKLANFITQFNFDLLSDFDEESLSLVVNALIYSENVKCAKIKGIEKETILPFYAILLKNWMKNSILLNDNIMNKVSEIQKLFLSTFKSMLNDDSPVIKASIDSILTCEINYEKSSFFKPPQKYEIIDSLIESVSNDEYCADKTILFTYFVVCSNLFRNVKQNLSGFFLYMINHLHEANYKSIRSVINFNFINKTKNIIDAVINVIQDTNSSETIVLNALYVITKLCKNCPKLKIEKTENLKNLLNDEKDKEKIELAVEFINSFNISDELVELTKKFQLTVNSNNENLIENDSFEKEIDELLLPILESKDIEIKDDLIHNLFKRMMKNQSLVSGYLQILFHKYDCSWEIKVRDFLRYFINEYVEYKELFIKALDCVRVFNKTQKSFIRIGKTNEFVYNESVFETTILFKLFESIKEKQGNYQAFFCLNSIACTFPFLLDSFAVHIFDIVLNELDNFHLVFDSDNDLEREKKVKTSICALSFLISSLHSNKMIDEFIIWFFHGINTFSNSTIFCLNYIIYSILCESEIRTVLMAALLKYNFIELIPKLLNRTFTNESFQANYFNMIYMLLDTYYYSLHIFNSYQVVYISEYKEKNNRFYNAFDHLPTFAPYLINHTHKKLFLNVPHFKIEKRTLSFIANIFKKREFWINYQRTPNYGHSIDSNASNLIHHYMKLDVKQKKAKLENGIVSPYEITIKMEKYLIQKERWVFSWFILDKKYPILNQHINVLSEVNNELKIIKNDYPDENEVVLNLNIEEIFKDQYEQKELFKMLIDKLSFFSNNESIFNNLSELLVRMTRDKKISKHFSLLIDEKLELIKDEEEKEGKNISNDLYLLLSLLSELFSSVDFKKKFIKKSLAKLVHFCLKPQCRTNESILEKIGKILISIHNHKLPIQVTHVICFMLLTKKVDFIKKALKICSKFNQNELEHMSIIHNSFHDVIYKENVNLELIKEYLKNIPSLLKSNHNDLMNLLIKKLEKKDESTNDELIVELINCLTPKRNQQKSIIMNDSINNQSSSFQPIPQFIWDSDPLFWETFSKHREVINDIIQSQLKKAYKSFYDDEEEEEARLNKRKCTIALFNDYPEFFSFQHRLELFQHAMKRRIISFRSTEIDIDPEHIIESSFNQLFFLPHKEWRYRIKIKYIQNAGIDLGGLRRDWFTKVTRELFNPNYGLFIATEKNSYQPSRLSYANPDHLKFFKFAGMIIGRVLLQGENVDCHLTRSFLRQILHRKVSLKDLEDSDENIFNSLQYILNNDIDNDQYNEYYFEVDKNDYGISKTIELKENGSDIKVTNESKSEFVDLMVDYHSRQSIIDQINSFCDGFDSIIPHRNIRIFTPGELDLLICGIPKIDVDDMRENTKCTSPYTKSSRFVVLFFDSIKKWSNANLAKLLMFITGSSQVPANGFRHYKDIGNPITIQPGGGKERLPVAHTCFNTIDLPEYETEEELNQKLMLAINEDSFQLG